MLTAYPNLFSQAKIGRLTLKNHIVMSPMDTNFANPDGTVSDQMVAYYTKRAAGGAGLILTEYISIDFPRGRGSINQLKMTDDSVIPGYRKLTNNIHAFGAKIFAQLHHAGDRSVAIPGELPAGPNEVEGKSHGLTEEEIADLVNRFAAAAKRAQAAGFDGVELHAGHGYLLGQFLSPLTNKRTDRYGEAMEGRARFLLEAVRAVRKAVGPNFVISVRLAIKDWAEGGITKEMGVEYAEMLDATGCVDMINCTTGLKSGWFGASETQDRPDGNRIDLAEAVKPHVKAAVAVVGKLRTGEMCENIIAEGKTDLVVIGRQLICDPEWPNKLRTGREKEVRTCLNCLEGCYAALGRKEGITCALNPYVGQEGQYDEGGLPQVKKPKEIAVIGGGVAGMQAALTAAERGHSVTLIEKSNRLGGQVNLAAVPPHKEILTTIVPWFEQRLWAEGVEILLDADARAEIEKLQPDKIVLATGSLPFVPPIPGRENAVESWAILSGEAPMPENKRIVVIGGGNVGCETALHLIEKGNNHIAIIEMLPTLSGGQEATHRNRDMALLKQAKANLQVNARVREITDHSVLYENAEGILVEEPADLVVVSTGQRPAGLDLYEELCQNGYDIVKAGDAMGMGNIRSNIRSGFLIGYHL